jgi:hypothetical protein
MGELKDRGLKQVTKYSVFFWCINFGWTCKIVDSYEEAIQYRGFGDFAGLSETVCIVPIDA